jgi:hypothetical protein
MLRLARRGLILAGMRLADATGVAVVLGTTAVALLFTVGAPCAMAQGEVPSESVEPAARPTVKSVDIVRFETPPRIDGRLDEPQWSTAVRITDFEQWSPGNGAPPTEPTAYLLAIDNDNLYIGAEFTDSDPAGIKRAQLVQGQAVFNDDYVQFFIDPYNNKRTGYIFYVNPNGVQRDGLALGGMSFNMDWDGIWDAAAEVTDTGWTAEIAIPFKTLSFDPRNEVWGINLLRSIRRKREELAWSQRNRRITMDTTGEIRGMRDLAQGAGLDIVPSVALTQRDRIAIGQTSFVPKPSLDAFWRVTPALTASLTLNTDFSATEVDDRQVNLTRFSLFFPEKRDFFLEGAELFEFGGLSQNGRPFFSRTIGLSATGQPIDLDAGLKLTGSLGRYSVGALAVRQEANGTVPARDLLVGRAFMSLFEQSTLGMIVTSGDPTADRDASLVGVDLNLRDRQWLDGSVVEGRIWAQQSRTEGASDDSGAWGALLAYPNDRFDASLAYTRIERNFRPALGFVNRRGIRQLDASAEHRHRFTNGGTLFRSWLSGASLSSIDNDAGELESRALILTPFTLDTQPGDQISLDLARYTEVLPRPFLLPGGVAVDPGRYDFDRLRLYGSTAGFRKLAATFEFGFGDFYDGRRRDYRLGLQWRPNRHLFMSALYQINDIELPGRAFATRVYSLTGNVAFNVRWAWLNVVQYDNISGRLGLNSRLRWLPRPGQQAYLVVNYDWREDVVGNFQPFLAETTAKFGYTFRF